MIVYGNYEMLLGGPQGANLEKPAEAHSYGEKSVALARLEVASDANDATARHDLSTSLSRLGALEPEPDGIQDSFAQLEEARRLLEPIVLANPKSSESANQLAFVLEHEGHRLETLGRNPEALAAYRKSMETINGFLSSKNSPTNSQYLSDEENIALLDAVMGDNVAALQLAKQALERAQQLGGEASRTVEQNIMLANAWSTLAIVQDRGGVFDQAKESARKAIFLWDMIQKPSLLVPFRRMIVRTRTLLPSQ
jgi:tetratricopeptide (TPR) repeat protein